MSWAAFTGFADVVADVGTVACFWWLVRLEVRFRKFELTDELMTRLLASEPGRIPELFSDMKGQGDVR